MGKEFNKEDFEKNYERCLFDTYRKEDGEIDHKQWASDCVEDIINDIWYDHINSWEFETEEDYAPYGDTYVGTGAYLADGEEDRCRDYFKGNVDVNDVCKELLKSNSFKVLVKHLVNKVAEESDIDV